MKSEIDTAIRSVIDDRAFIGGRTNKYVTAFEREWSDYLGIRNVVGCGNGTDALEIVLEAMGIGPGVEVIVPAMTWIATAGAVARVGAKPILADISAEYRTIDPSRVESLITDQTRAIIPVHLYGLPAAMDEIMEIGKRHSLKVIEDAAQAHGAKYKNRNAGTIADASIFSFYPGKNLGAFGDAGCIATNDDDLADICRQIANHGQREKHDFKRIGRNSRMDGIHAAVLSAKLSRFNHDLGQRIDAAQWYTEMLEEIGVDTPNVPADTKHAYHLYVVTVDPERRSDTVAFLSKHGIQTGIHYPESLDEHVSFVEQKGSCPVAADLSRSGLSLPLFPGITKDEIRFVVEHLEQAR